MKKLLATILCCAMLVSVTACSTDSGNSTEATTATNAITTEPIEATSELNIEDAKKQIAEKLKSFEGIVYLTKNGEVIHSQAIGKDEGGADLTVESPMYIGSVSKQFCSTAIMILKEQGKLSVDDTLDKYFPEYELGKNITIKNLLTMRSGIPDMLGLVEGYSADKTESENIAIINDWIFEQSLNFEPDSRWEYSNTNYYLVALIVEKVSGEYYQDFIRENIFKPLEMNNSGFVNEVDDNEFYSSALTYDTFACDDEIDGWSKGSGELISTAPDMDKWMTGLRSGKIISDESYREMIADYSPDLGEAYGYAIQELYKNGRGHTGHIGDYICFDYYNEEYGYNLFVATTKTQNTIMMSIPKLLMDILTNE